MPLYALPTITEDVFAQYIAANYTGSYPVVKAFTSEPRSSPMVAVKAAQFKEIEPGTHVYEGTLAVAIFTQIDDADPDESDDAEARALVALTTHDLTVAEIYDIMSNTAALTAYVNNAETTGDNFNLWAIYELGYDQEREDRSFKSVITYSIRAQTLPVG